MYVLREVPGTTSAPTKIQITSLKGNYPHIVMKNVVVTSQMYNRHVNPLLTIFREIWLYYRNMKPVSLIIYELIHKAVNSVTDFNANMKFF
jgi:hypothetical protein